MFFVKNGCVEQRRKIVEEHAEINTAVGLILAAINFEWTYRRVVKVLSRSSLGDVKKSLAKAFGVEAFKKIWNDEVKRGSRSAPSLVEMFAAAGVAWSGPKEKAPGILEAFHERDKMVHGCRSKTGDGYLKKRIGVLLAAVDAMEAFATSNGYNIYTDVLSKAHKNLKKVRSAE